MWSKVEEKKRLSLVAWENVCKPKSRGEMGMRRIKIINRALLDK